MTVSLKDFGVVCALGLSKQEVLDNLVASNIQGVVFDEQLPLFEGQFVGRVNLPSSGGFSDISTRNNQLAYLAYEQIRTNVEMLIKQYGATRLAVVIGTSTSGIFEGELACRQHEELGEFPATFEYKQQEMIAPAHFIADLCHAKGPVYSISTACSSSGKALTSAKALIESGVADIVIAGGVDSLAQLTVNGFKALESISSGRCQPFCQARDGINIGEAAALFVVSKDCHRGDIQLLGTGESSDAYHISSPLPDGSGAAQAMLYALGEAGVSGQQIDYVNLHGTATIKNDEMEAKAMFDVCGPEVFCGSTKAMTGHTLGAAGALEVGLCWLLLSHHNVDSFIPANVCQSSFDPLFNTIKLSTGQTIDNINYCMSNSFAFGGNNFSAVLGKNNE